METMKFKTTIKCSGCVANVTPALNEVAGERNWEVDTAVPDKILTITSEKGITAEKVIAAIDQAGYKAERLN
ncbi:MAG TPA: heavy-metal-associated domain-containing protein [Chitinophagaceae bacterium]|nr:heavy-metal-associated domain-containing protein [Chitinophagaceae bacterium]